MMRMHRFYEWVHRCRVDGVEKLGVTKAEAAQVLMREATEVLHELMIERANEGKDKE